MKHYTGLKVEKIDFSNKTDILTGSLDGCWSVVAFAQAPQGTSGWAQCQRAIEAGFSDEGFGFYWVSARGADDPGDL